MLNQTSEIYGISDYGSIGVAVSGGSDSISLLMLAQAWGCARGVNVVCITVDHGLRSESADEAMFVRDLCYGIGVEHHILEWKRPYPEFCSESTHVVENSRVSTAPEWENSHDIPHGKLENMAREARYDLLKNFCHNRNISLILTGHTLNDQLETHEMRKISGSSDLGLAGMSRIRSISDKLKLLRPLLGFSKKQLEKFLVAKNISWKKDPMNEDDSFRRVVMRKQIMSYDDEKMLASIQEIQRLRKIRHELEVNAVNFLKSKVFLSDFGYASLHYDALLLETTAVQREIIRRVIWNVGGKKYATGISEEILERILNRQMNTIGRCFLKIKKNMLYIFRENRTNNPSFVLLDPHCGIFDGRFVLESKSDLSDCKALWHWEKEIPGISDNCRNIGLPCIYRDNKIVFVYGFFCDSQMKINAYFVQKVNLFDIFL